MTEKLGEMLDAAINEFEGRFAVVDDHYMHHGSAATEEGVPFVVCCAGSPETPHTDHAAAIAEWLKLAADLDTNEDHDYLAWRARPVFEAAGEGFMLRSRLATGSVAELSDATKARLGLG